MNFTTPRYAILFSNSENRIMHVINHEWNRCMFFASTMCFVWDTKPDLPTIRRCRGSCQGRCRESGRQQLRYRASIEQQRINFKNRSSIDPPSVEKLSMRQELSRSIHQVSRRWRDCVKKKAWEARQIVRYRGGVEPVFQNSFSRGEKHRYECNLT